MQKETDANSTSISEMSTNFKVTADGLSATKSAVQTLIDAVNGTVSKEALQQYIRWNGGDLALGNSVQPCRCKLSNTELAFYQNEDKVAWISNKELYILKYFTLYSLFIGFSLLHYYEFITYIIIKFSFPSLPISFINMILLFNCPFLYILNL